MAAAGANDLIYVLALALEIVICLRARSLGARLGVMAHPDNGRRRHKQSTPQLGGVAMLCALVVWLIGAWLTDQGPDHSALTAILFCVAGVGLIGFTDDQHDTSPLSRILSVIVFLGCAAVIDPMLLTTRLHWASFDPGLLPGWGYCLIAGFAVIGLVNAVNMADGQDGVVGSMFAVWSACLMLVLHGPLQGVAALLFGASLIFLAFNLAGKLFMGDCGTYGVTFAFAMLAIGAHARGLITIEPVIVWFFIPVMDCLRLLISRPMRGSSPFVGDRDHFHHRLEDKLGKQGGLVAYGGAVAASSLAATLEPKFALLSLAMLSAFYFSFAWLSDTTKAAILRNTEKPANSNVAHSDGERRTTASSAKD